MSKINKELEEEYKKSKLYIVGDKIEFGHINSTDTQIRNIKIYNVDKGQLFCIRGTSKNWFKRELNTIKYLFNKYFVRLKQLLSKKFLHRATQNTDQYKKHHRP